MLVWLGAQPLLEEFLAPPCPESVLTGLFNGVWSIQHAAKVCKVGNIDAALSMFRGLAPQPSAASRPRVWSTGMLERAGLQLWQVCDIHRILCLVSNQLCAGHPTR